MALDLCWLHLIAAAECGLGFDNLFVSQSKNNARLASQIIAVTIDFAVTI